MALVLKDRVRETSISVGTGTIDVLGAVTGYQTFLAAVGSGNTCYYTIYNQGTNEWEVGIGTVGTGTLARNTILSSSNAGSPVSFSAGTKDVFLTYPAERSVFENAAGNIDGFPITGGTINGTTIGATTASTGAFTTLGATTGNITTVNATTVDTTNIEVTTLKAKDGTTAGSIADSTGVVTLASSVLTTTDINGGTLDNATVGATTASTGAFTSLSSTSGALNGTVGATTPAAGTFTSLTDSGNLTFTGTGNRILGDFSNGTVSNRVAIQTSTTNGSTSLTVLPNGTGSVSGVNFYSSSDVNNANLAQLAIITGAEARLQSNATGTASFVPLTIYTGGTERMRIDSAGNVGIGTISPSNRLHVVSGTQVDADGIIRAENSTGSTANASVVVKSHHGTSQLMQWEANGVRIGSRITTNGGAGNVIFTSRNDEERMRIDSAGNVGIGTSSFLFGVAGRGVLEINGSASSLMALKRNNLNSAYMFASSTALEIINIEATSTVFFTSGQERARITAGGALLAGGSTTPTNGSVIQSGQSISVPNNGTITLSSSVCGGALISVYNTFTGLGGLFFLNFSSTATKITGDGEATDTGSTFAVYKSASSHTATFRNRSGSTATFTMTILAGLIG